MFCFDVSGHTSHTLDLLQKIAQRNLLVPLVTSSDVNAGNFIELPCLFHQLLDEFLIVLPSGWSKRSFITPPLCPLSLTPYPTEAIVSLSLSHTHTHTSVARSYK